MKIALYPEYKSDRKIVKSILKLKSREDAKELFAKLSPQEKEVFLLGLLFAIADGSFKHVGNS